MKCAQAEQWLQLYVDDRLESRRLAALERHLQTCDPCQQDLVLLRFVSHAVASPAPVREPDGLTEAIMCRVAQAQTHSASAPRVFEPAWVDAVLAAVLATLATACFLVFQPALRAALARNLDQALLALNHTAVGALGDSPGWLAWGVCIGLGLLLTLAFAGGEVRAAWWRNLMTRLPHAHLDRQPA